MLAAVKNRNTLPLIDETLLATREGRQGLTTHRKKEVRDPRVKKRMKYEERQTKLRSVKAVYKSGEGPSRYQGEVSDIKAGLVKSV
jgi:U3 small nucleolar RNA-associated protein 3